MIQNTPEYTKEIRFWLKEKVCSRTDFPTNQQNVHTPFELCHEMIDRLERSAAPLHEKTFLTFNLEFVEVLCYDFGAKKENIWFVTDCKQKANVTRHPRYVGVHVEPYEYLSLENNAMKFDVIVGNPPYQAPQEIRNAKGISGGGNTLWDKFVGNSFVLLKENGYLCLVHPSGWRDIGGKFADTKNLLLSKNIKYLEMHSATDGQATFGAATCYDWYVVQNTPSNGKTLVVNEEGVREEVDLSKIPFVPSGMYKDILKLIAKNGTPTCDVIHSHSAYETRKEWVSEKETSKYKYPLIYTITQKDGVNVWYSSTNQNGHFGVPKVIFTNGAGCTPIVDATGEYGMCQFAYGIADDPKNLPLIQQAMVSEKFLQIMKACQMQGFNRYSWKVMKSFRKDFWKEFVQ